MAKLYVIGNGFDLWHKLPTSYVSFYNFAKETLDEIEAYYLLDVKKAVPWSDFENSLGQFNWKEFYKSYNNIDVSAEDFRPSFVYGLEDDLNEQADQHVEAIRECFHEWVTGIDVSKTDKRLGLSKSAQFITFNYTSTLELIYSIENGNILHIHGRADGNSDQLVFGHGEVIKEEPELDENGESRRTIFSDAEGAAKYPFYALQKPVDKVIRAHRNFFDSLGQTSEIIVIGHSLNKIDVPYFKEICGKTPNAGWTICLHEPDKKYQFMQVLIECGVQPERIYFCEYQDLEVYPHHG